MRQVLRVVLGCCVLIAALAAAGQAVAGDGGRKLSTSLTGAEECTSLGVCGVGDPDGSGTADLRVNYGQRRVCFTISVANIGPAGQPVRAHIHRAPAGMNGPVVVPLVEPPAPMPASGVLSGCSTATRELIREITRNPELFYVNVHTPEFPGGAVRGQLGD